MNQMPTKIVTRRLLIGFFTLFGACGLGTLTALGQSTEGVTPERISWQKGPTLADLGGVAEIRVPKGFAFTDGAGTKKFLEFNHNPASGDEVGLIVPVVKAGERGPDWFMTFEFEESGYVSDDENHRSMRPLSYPQSRKVPNKPTRLESNEGGSHFTLLAGQSRLFTMMLPTI
jgi:hypothetical protein